MRFYMALDKSEAFHITPGSDMERGRTTPSAGSKADYEQGSVEPIMGPTEIPATTIDRTFCPRHKPSVCTRPCNDHTEVRPR